MMIECMKLKYNKRWGLINEENEIMIIHWLSKSMDFYIFIHNNNGW